MDDASSPALWEDCQLGESDMRSHALPLIAAVAMLAGAAFAQTSNTSNLSGSSRDNSSAASSSSASTSQSPDTAVTVDTQQKLKQSLEQNGFKNVLVVPEAYVIHAQAPDGSKIVMEVSPDQMRAVVERTGTSR
jgi:pectate lyase